MVDFSTVDLSIFRLDVDIKALKSFTRELNWSRRFFSLRLRDFLQRRLRVTKKTLIKKIVWQEALFIFLFFTF